MTDGLKVVLSRLAGGSEYDPNDFLGKTIIRAELINDRIELDFSDGTQIDVWDDGQSCCENRYITTDDDLKTLVGHELTRIVAKDGPSKGEDWDIHETCFVEIGTEASFVTLVTHNEHNGYYGGFALTITDRGKDRF
jgi:hypothetical protein